MASKPTIGKKRVAKTTSKTVAVPEATRTSSRITRKTTVTSPKSTPQTSKKAPPITTSPLSNPKTSSLHPFPKITSSHTSPESTSKNFPETINIATTSTLETTATPKTTVETPSPPKTASPETPPHTVTSPGTSETNTTPKTTWPETTRTSSRITCKTTTTPKSTPQTSKKAPPITTSPPLYPKTTSPHPSPKINSPHISPESTSKNSPETTNIATTSTLETTATPKTIVEIPSPPKTASPETTPHTVTTPGTASETNTTPKTTSPETTRTSSRITRKTTTTPKSTPQTSKKAPPITTSPPSPHPSPKINSPHISPESTSKNSPETTNVATTSTLETTATPKSTVEIQSPPKTASPETTPHTVTTPVTASETNTTPKTTSPETTAQTSNSQATATETTVPPKTTSKGATRIIKKVIKKKIVKKKLVPKRAKTASVLPSEEKREEEVKEEKLQIRIEEQNPTPTPTPIVTPNSNESVEVGNPSFVPAENELEHGNLESDNPSVADNEVENKSGDGNEKEGGGMAVGEEEVGLSERQKRRKTEIFIGGLDKDAKEEDIQKVFEKVGEVVEIRVIKNSQTGKNKGYAFLRYASAADAKRAVTELTKVEVCGKQCGAAPLEGNDTVFLGGIDKNWKKDDVMKLLQEIGIENIDTITIMMDPNKPDYNRGFAFLELETNKDAQIAYKKLQKKNAFGKDLNIKVAWAEPLKEPDEEEMLKVKSVYLEGMPSSWDEEKVRKHFNKFGEIERIVLSRNIQSAKRKDFAFVNYATRESALECIESFNNEELVDEGSKVNVKVSLAKPASKSKQSKSGPKSIHGNSSKEKPKAVKCETRVALPMNKGRSVRLPGSSDVGKKPSATHELIQVLREQAAWGQGHSGLNKGYSFQDYTHTLPGAKRPFAVLGDNMLYSDPRGYPRARLDSSYPAASSSYSTPSHSMAGVSVPYYQHPGAGYAAVMPYGTSSSSGAFQRQGAPAYNSGVSPRY